MANISWNYGDVGTHSSTIGMAAGNLAEVRRSIMTDVTACADFWKSQGQGAFDQFVNELNRNFEIIYQSLGDHGTSVGKTLGNTQDHDMMVGKSWGV